MTRRHDRPVAVGGVSGNVFPARPPAWLRALRARLPRSPREVAVAVAALIAAVGLGIDAYVHLDLASTYAEAQAPINEGVLFRAEAVLAILAALILIVSARRLPFVLGFVVSASALAVMLVSRYVDLGPLGPFPDLYDPVWYAEKLWAAGGEAAAVIATAAGILLLSPLGQPRRGTAAAGKMPRPRGGRFAPRR